MSEAISTNGDIDITDIAEKMQQYASIQTLDNSGGPRKVSEVLDGHYKKVMARSQRTGMTGAKTASVDFDNMSGGHQNKDLIIVAARPSVGKTAWLVNDSTEASRGGSVPLIFSAEMTAEDVSERHICSIGNIDSKKVRTGLLTDTDWEKYSKALDILDTLEIYIDDTPGMSVEYIERKIKEFKKKIPNLTVYIDYLQLIETEKEFSKSHERVNYVSKKLKQIGTKYDVPVIAISSVGRKCEDRNDKRPLMSDLRESGNIEFDADVIIFLYRDDYYYPDTVFKGIIELIVAKGRKIGTGTIQMVFNRKTGQFINLNSDDKYKLAEKVRDYEQQRKNRR
ncbi:Replicative DNA helicase [compost metagenome]